MSDDAASVPAAGADGWMAVCLSDRLAEGGDGQRFELSDAAGVAQAAFVVRVEGAPRAYLNRCAHVPVELDWLPGRFLDESGLYVICTVHGALYDATDGACVGGPCHRKGLQPLYCREADGWVWVRSETVPSSLQKTL